MGWIVRLCRRWFSRFVGLTDTHTPTPHTPSFGGGTIFETGDLTSYWQSTAHFLTWFKNNVERRKKFNMMIADSSTEKMAEADCDPTGKSQSRVLFYKAVVRLVSNIQAMHSNNLAEPDGRLKLFALPEPIPNYIRPRLAKLMRTHHFLPTDHDMKLIAMGDSVPAVAAKKVKPPKSASLSASGGGGYGGGYGAGVGVGAGGGVAAAGHHTSHGYSETSHKTQKPRHLRQCYTEEDLYAQTYKKQRSAPAPASAWDSNPYSPSSSSYLPSSAMAASASMQQQQQQQAWGVDIREKPVVMDKSVRDLCIEELVLGTPGRTVRSGDFITIDFTGFSRLNGEVVQFDDEGKNFQFETQLGEVIKGLDDGVVGMSIGGQRRIFIPPKFAYGKLGSYPDVPPGASVIMEVTLKQIYTRVVDNGE